MIRIRARNLSAGLLAGILVLSGCGGGGGSSEEQETGGEKGPGSQTQEGNEQSKKEVTPGNAAAQYVGSALKAKESAEQLAALKPLQQAIRQFQGAEGRLPKSLKELVSEGYIGSIPTVGQGRQVEYDPKTGSVSLVKTQ